MPTSPIITQQARAAADRIDADAVGIAPGIIFSILSLVIPSLLSCLRGEEPNPDEVQAAVLKARERNPDRLQKRVRNRVTRKAKRQGQKLSREQADTMASAVINQACEVTSATVAACMAAAPDVDDDDGDDS